MDIPILYEDDTLLVINKPPGIVVNNAESVKGETIQDWSILRQARLPAGQGFGKQAEQLVENKDFFDRAGIVHRIDKETSGCLLIAKDPDTFMTLQRQFKERKIKKTYLAVVHGLLVPEEGEIRAPIGRLPWNRERFGIVPEGKEAVTRYRVLNVIPASRSASTQRGEPGYSEKKEWVPLQARNDKLEKLSLVELYPETGRTHQVRVHLKYINHPIVGDWQYAGRKTARVDRTRVGRVMLHAQRIEFCHPRSGVLLAIEAPVPDDMKSIV